MTGATAVTIGTAAATAAAGALVTSMLAPKPKTPAVQAPTPMPGQNAGDAARRKSIMEQQSRQGRASTILTDGGDTLG